MMHNEYAFDAIMRAIAVAKAMREVGRNITEEEMYQIREYGCTSNLTDEDMLKLHIDIALTNDDREMFLDLTEQLREVATV